MKKIIAIFFLVFIYSTNAQWLPKENNAISFNCDMHSGLFADEFSAGNYKPERTDLYPGTSSTSVFPVLIVFVKFPSGEPFPAEGVWPPNGDPVFLNKIIAGQRNSNYGNAWWDAYSGTEQRLSDFWMEASRGHFHVIGKAYSITLPLSASQYKSLYGIRGIEKINDDIYSILVQLIPTAEWQFFDQWKKENNTFVNSPDNYIDMIYKIHRSWADSIGMPSGGIAKLYNSYQYGYNYPIPNTLLQINGTFGTEGSGLTITPAYNNPPIDLKGTVSFTSHEHGHYLFGSNHAMYGKMSGTEADFGVDECLSPWESIKLGYITPTVVDYGSGNYLFQLGDYSSRNNNELGEVLKVPVNVNEYFLIASRRKTSEYDKIMWGDTARGSPYRIINPDYGKGIYIYHTPSGYAWPPLMDMECADGLWNYEQTSWEHPDWDTSLVLLPYYKKLAPVFFKNDNSEYDYIYNPGTTGLAAKDGKDVNKAFYNSQGWIHITSYFGNGKKEEPPGSWRDGKDRIFTNMNEVWTSRENYGDRWDAWNIGYNQIFSPYSSPSTAGWQNSEFTGIFIYYYSQTGEFANIKVYRASSILSLDTILMLTPPSKPVINYVVDVVNCSGGTGSPKIKWTLNKEPDMDRNGSHRKYKIFRAFSSSVSEIPFNYENIAELNYSGTETTNGFYIDTTAFAECENKNILPTGYLRYKVMAIDKYDSVSILSDFASLQGTIYPIGIQNSQMPAVFTIGNYPNPFNPVCIIKYSLPKKSHVVLKIYNITGQEIKTLVDEKKSEGIHTINFDGSDLSSGVYFYKIYTGSFVKSGKMVLLK